MQITALTIVLLTCIIPRIGLTCAPSIYRNINSNNLKAYQLTFIYILEFSISIGDIFFMLKMPSELNKEEIKLFVKPVNTLERFQH